MVAPDAPVYDLVGIGFGPSNLAVAVAIAVESQAWAVARMHEMVAYGHTVTDVVPVIDGCDRDAPAYALEVITAHADGVSTARARDVSVAAGLESSLPAGVHPSEREGHDLDSLRRTAIFDMPSQSRFVVVGAGEIVTSVVAGVVDRRPVPTGATRPLVTTAG